MKPLEVVVSRASPVLKGDGYRRFGPTFNRERESGLVHVVNFQGSKWGDEFTVNLGVQIREVWELVAKAGDEVARRLRVEMPDLYKRTPQPAPSKPRKCVLEPECQLRLRLGQLIPPHRDKWWKYSQLDVAIKQVSEALSVKALPYLDSYATRKEIANRWMTGSAQRFDGDWLGAKSARDLLLKASLLKGLGNEPETAKLIETAIKESEGQRWHEWAVWVAQRIQNG